MKNTMSVCLQSNVIYISDTCYEQNRHHYVTSPFLYTISQVPQLITLSHKFLLSGHSQMECDLLYLTIETSKERRLCKFHHNKYISKYVPMKYHHVVNFKKYIKQYCPSPKVSTSSQRIHLCG